MSELAEYFREYRRDIARIPGDELNRLQLLQMKAIFTSCLRSCEMFAEREELIDPNAEPTDYPPDNN